MKASHIHTHMVIVLNIHNVNGCDNYDFYDHNDVYHDVYYGIYHNIYHNYYVCNYGSCDYNDGIHHDDNVCYKSNHNYKNNHNYKSNHNGCDNNGCIDYNLGHDWTDIGCKMYHDCIY